MSFELNTIFNEDCLTGMNDIPDHSVDLILVDPPYGTTRCKWDTIIPFDEMWRHYNRIAKDNAAILIFGTEPFSSTLRISNIKYFRYDWIWKKTIGTGNMNANKMPLKKHEIISVFYKKLPTYNPQFFSGTPYTDNRAYGNNDRREEELYGSYVEHNKPIINSGTRYPTSVIEFSNPNHNRLHKTEKPLELIEFFIKTYSNEGDVVLDNCMGSGTTAVGCIDLNRRFIGYEKDETIYNIAVNRANEAKHGTIR